MRVFKLIPDEYDALAKVADGTVPDPRNSIAIMAIDKGEYEGRVFVIAPAHIEGVWVSKKYRGSKLFSVLVHRAEDEARKSGIKQLFAYGANKEMEDYIGRLGYAKQELTVWKKEL